jgi:hypothetical protein
VYCPVLLRQVLLHFVPFHCVQSHAVPLQPDRVLQPLNLDIVSLGASQLLGSENRSNGVTRQAGRHILGTPKNRKFVTYMSAEAIRLLRFLLHH